ncbi:MAG: hypothetical protein NZM42_13535, partial [Gemmatales bacterium]|nr:hypothetical protein [Gemmatales bacterium]
FWQAGIGGADFFISAIGPAVAVFGKYRQVMRPDGQVVQVGELLDETRSFTTGFALQQLGLTELDGATRFYVLYRWAYGGQNLDFDAANKLAKGVGAELDELERRYGLIRRRGAEVSLPSYAERLSDGLVKRWLASAENDGQIAAWPGIDHLHLSLWWWQKGEREALAQWWAHLNVTGEHHPFWKIAQAVLEVERQQQDGKLAEEVQALEQLLGSRRGLLREAAAVEQSKRQPTFFDMP